MKKKLLLASCLLLASSLIVSHGGGGGGGHGFGGGGHGFGGGGHGHSGGGHSGYHGGGHGGGHGGYGHGGYGHGGYGRGGYGYGYGGFGLGLGVGLLATMPFLYYGQTGYPYSYDNGPYENPNYDPDAAAKLDAEKARGAQLDNASTAEDSDSSQGSQQRRIQELEAELARYKNNAAAAA